MKKMTKVMSVLLVVAMLLTMAACTDPAGNSSSTAPSTTTKPSGNTNDGKVNYTVKVQSAGGMVLENVDIVIRQGDSTVDVGRTDSTGTKTFRLAAGKEYTVELANVPAGYDVRDSYSFNGTGCEIMLVSSVITGEESFTGKKFQLGDIMYDFSFTDHSTYICPECGALNDVQHGMTGDGKYALIEDQLCTECEAELKNAAHPTTTLAETLEEKKMVMLNFWYNGCSWCYKEFPAINTIYGKYADQAEIFALNDYPSQTVAEVAGWRNEMELDFPMGLISNGMGIGSFGGGGWPMTVIIDRYGMIAMAHSGAITSTSTWDQIFKHFTAEDYKQKLVVDYEDIVTQTPVTEVFPGSDVIGETINQGDLTVNYYPASKETDGESWEYIWPFVTTTYNGEDCIKASNVGVDTSYSILYADVQMTAGQVLAFDYIVSTDLGNDIVYVIVNGEAIYQMSGFDQNPQWQTCYPMVALEDGTYQVAICYAKDGSGNAGDDTFYIDNMRIVDQSEIQMPTYIPRQAAVEQADGSYKYVEIFYNEADGYYHVGSENGPLLLANLMGYTQLIPDNYIYYLALQKEFVKNGYDYCNDLTPFASYANNATVQGFCPVTQELAEILKVVAEIKGYEGVEEEWLKVCKYYDAYGTNGVQMEDPIKGLAPFSAPEAVLGTWKLNQLTMQWVFTPEDDDLPAGDYNYFYYDRIIMPRGKFYKFTPEVSGAYRFTSHSANSDGVEGWIFLDEDFIDRVPLYTHETEERFSVAEGANLSMIYYMEAGQTYYIDIAFWDVNATGYIPFDVEFLGETYAMFRQASAPFFTYEEGTEFIISGGIDVALGDDGVYYHVVGKDENGNNILGSKVYVDFTEPNRLFGYSVKTLIERGYFDYSKNEQDQEILVYLKNHNYDVEATREYLKNMWGEDYDENAALYKLEEVLAGKYHGAGTDMTDTILAYMAAMEQDQTLVTYGCVEVTEELANILQGLMDKMTFEGVTNSWLKLCYYFDYMGQ